MASSAVGEKRKWGGIAPSASGLESAVPGQKKLQTGLCKCSSCGQWSKDIEWETLLIALNKKGRDQCCYICLFHLCGCCPVLRGCGLGLEKKAFQHLTWADFCSEEESIIEGKKEARQLLTSGTRPWAVGVENDVTYGFVISKDYLVCNSSELKKITKLNRLPKKLTQGIPQVRVGEEDVFVFSDPNQTMRRGTLQVSSVGHMKTTTLSANDVLWAGQPASHFDSKKDPALTSLLSASLMTPHEFLLKRLGQSEEVAAGVRNLGEDFAAAVGQSASVHAREDDEEDEEDDDDAPLLGPAAPSAAAMSMESRPLPSLKKFFGKGGDGASTSSVIKASAITSSTTKPSLARLKTSTYSAAASIDDQSVVDDGCVSLAGKSKHSTPDPKGDKLAEWRGKCSIQGLFDGVHDGRSVNGMRQAINQLKKKEQAHPDLISLQNYLTCAEAAWTLKHQSLTNTGDNELAKAIKDAQQEVTVWPEDIQMKLLTRRCSRLAEQQNHKQLLEVCNPFLTGEWDATLPTLSGVSTSFEQKLDTWNSTIFSDILQTMLGKGQAWQEEVMKLTQIILDYLDERVNVMEGNLDYTQAMAREDCALVCRVLVAILADDLDSSCLDHSLG
eukprot:6482116-Amphidinium_carterae.2